MRRFYTRLGGGALLHVLVRAGDLDEARQDLSDDEEPLQVSCFSMSEGQSFKPHVHITNVRQIGITQESWVVVRGRVKVFYYDTDGSFLEWDILKAGDCTITYRGGHTYMALEDETLVYEFKNGPYLGRESDKRIIGEAPSGMREEELRS